MPQLDVRLPHKSPDFRIAGSQTGSPRKSSVFARLCCAATDVIELGEKTTLAGRDLDSTGGLLDRPAIIDRPSIIERPSINVEVNTASNVEMYTVSGFASETQPRLLDSETLFADPRIADAIAHLGRPDARRSIDHNLAEFDFEPRRGKATISEPAASIAEASQLPEPELFMPKSSTNRPSTRSLHIVALPENHRLPYIFGSYADAVVPFQFAPAKANKADQAEQDAVAVAVRFSIDEAKRASALLQEYKPASSPSFLRGPILRGDVQQVEAVMTSLLPLHKRSVKHRPALGGTGLLKHTQVNSVDSEGRTLTHTAVLSGVPESVEALAKLGIAEKALPLDIEDKHGLTPTHYAAMVGNARMLHALGVAVNARERSERTIFATSRTKLLKEQLQSVGF